MRNMFVSRFKVTGQSSIHTQGKCHCHLSRKMLPLLHE
jgi:hypothetical protein